MKKHNKTSSIVNHTPHNDACELHHDFQAPHYCKFRGLERMGGDRSTQIYFIVTRDNWPLLADPVSLLARAKSFVPTNAQSRLDALLQLLIRNELFPILTSAQLSSKSPQCSSAKIIPASVWRPQMHYLTLVTLSSRDDGPGHLTDRHLTISKFRY